MDKMWTLAYPGGYKAIHAWQVAAEWCWKERDPGLREEA